MICLLINALWMFECGSIIARGCSSIIFKLPCGRSSVTLLPYECLGATFKLPFGCIK